MKKILIIDDSKEIRENTLEILEISNYQVQTAGNGESGYILAGKYIPDLILCDIMMPETDGNFFFKLIKADPKLKHIPVVFFSAGSSQHIERELRKSANGFIKKPFTETELLTTIRHLLAN